MLVVMPRDLSQGRPAQRPREWPLVLNVHEHGCWALQVSLETLLYYEGGCLGVILNAFWYPMEIYSRGQFRILRVRLGLLSALARHMRNIELHLRARVSWYQVIRTDTYLESHERSGDKRILLEFSVQLMAIRQPGCWKSLLELDVQERDVPGIEVSSRHLNRLLEPGPELQRIERNAWLIGMMCYAVCREKAYWRVLVSSMAGHGE